MVHRPISLQYLEPGLDAAPHLHGAERASQAVAGSSHSRLSHVSCHAQRDEESRLLVYKKAVFRGALHNGSRLADYMVIGHGSGAERGVIGRWLYIRL